MATANFRIAPEDGWTKVADTPGFIRITAAPLLPFYVCVLDSAPAASVLGIQIRAGEVFEINQPMDATFDVYVRVQDSTPDNDIRIDVESEGIAATAPLPSGAATAANQVTEIASLSVLDDWDESDRAKVNSIVGQAGVAGGAGAVGATTQRIVQAGLDYETVAASQTAQVMGATGATGDFLSHVIFQPVTTAAGTCTILDNATVIFTYTTGTLADLRPITIPVNAISVSGAWKITTGANVTATAFGDFT